MRFLRSGQQRLGLLQLTVAELRDLETRLQGGLALGPAASNPFASLSVVCIGASNREAWPTPMVFCPHRVMGFTD